MMQEEQKRKTPKIDLTGMRSGKLVITQQTDDIISSKGGRCEAWLADCDCGTKNIIVNASDFKLGRIKSCGCTRPSIIGRKFDRLTVINRDPENKDKVICQCECGNIISVYTGNLYCKYTRSCGCFMKESISQRCRKYNDYIIKNNYIEWKDSSGNIFYTDIEDFDLVYPHCWHKDHYGRIVCNSNIAEKTSYMKLHRLIMGVIDQDSSIIIDHINHNQSDNRKCNLRIVTQTQNMQNVSLRSNNTSGCTGVRWNKRKNKWYSSITVNKHVISLGYYADFNEAVKVRKDAEEKYFGEYSYDNSIKLGEQNEENIS